MSQPESNPRTPPLDCDQLRDLIPAYIAGGIDAQEKAQIEASLEYCPEVAEELREYLAVTQALLFEPEPMQPPAFLHDKIMRAANPPVTKPLSPTQPIRSMRPVATAVPQPRRFPASRVWASLAAVTALLLVVTNIYWLAQVNELRDLNADVADLLAEERFVLASLGAGQSQRVELLAGDGAVSATVLWSPLIERALLYTDQLPPLAPDRAYQLWTIGADGPLSEGVFQLDEQGTGVLVFTPREPLSDYDAIAISSEPASGSPAPTTDPVAVGEV